MAAIRAKSITVTVKAILITTGAPQTGDAANITIQVIKDGVTGASTNAVAEVSAANAPGIYKLVLTASEMTADFVAVMGKSTTANVRIDGWQDSTFRVPDVDPGAANGLMITGANTGPWSVSGGVTFSNSTGNGLTLSSSGSNGHGLSASGNGTGIGLIATGGLTGNGIKAVGGGTSGDAILTSATSGHGATFAGTGTTKHGINATGGATSSDGIHAVGGGTGAGVSATSASPSSGNGLFISNNNASVSVTNAALSIISTSAGQRAVEIINSTTGSTGIYVQGGNSTSGTGLLVEGASAVGFVALQSTGVALSCGGGARGIDIAGTDIGLAVNARNANAGSYAAIFGTMFGNLDQVIIGEMTGTHRGLVVNSTGGDAVVINSFTGPGGGFNGNGLSISGNGSGVGMSITGGATGNGVTVNGGATSGDAVGLVATAGNGNGLKATGVGAGRGIYAIGGTTSTAGVRAEAGSGSNGNGLEGILNGSGVGIFGVPVSGGGTMDANVVSIDGQLTNGTNATLNLKKLNIVNPAGDAVVASGTTNGINATASAGVGIVASGTTNGLSAAASAGSGITASGTTNGLNATASAGPGIHATGSTNGVLAAATAGNGSGLKLTGFGSGSGIDGSGSAALWNSYLDLANAIEVGLTPRQMGRLGAAADAGLLSGAGTATQVIKGAGVATTRITATVDASGNRTAITLSP